MVKVIWESCFLVYVPAANWTSSCTLLKMKKTHKIHLKGHLCYLASRSGLQLTRAVWYDAVGQVYLELFMQYRLGARNLPVFFLLSFALWTWTNHFTFQYLAFLIWQSRYIITCLPISKGMSFNLSLFVKCIQILRWWEWLACTWLMNIIFSVERLLGKW